MRAFYRAFCGKCPACNSTGETHKQANVCPVCKDWRGWIPAPLSISTAWLAKFYEDGMSLLKMGQRVRVRRMGEGEWTHGIVTLQNGRYSMLSVDGIRVGTGNILGGLPLSWDPDTNQFRGLVVDELYQVELLP